MEPDDGLEEAVDGQMRVLLTVAAHVGERVARARENQYHQNQTQSETEARQLQDRLDAERAVARAEMSKTQREDWWDRATPTEIAYTYQVACAWSGEEPEAVRTQDKIRTELKNRYDLDVDNLNADPAAVQTAVQRAYNNHATTQREHRRSNREQTEAHLLLSVANREELLDSLNPTGTIQTEYGPEHRATAPLAANMVPLSQTQNIDGTETITIYRGVPADVDQAINPGDYITTNPQLAADYAGTGNVIQEDVPAAHILVSWVSVRVRFSWFFHATSVGFFYHQGGCVMSTNQVPPGRGSKKVLSPSMKYEIWLRLVRGEVTMGQAATEVGVDRSTIVRLRKVAKEGALDALAASRPGRGGKSIRDLELEASQAEVARLTEAVKELAVKVTLLEKKGAWE